MPALPPCILDPLWDQFAALLPSRPDTHPLGCHRRRIPDRVLFDKLIQVLVFGCGYRRIADDTCSASTLRRRRDEWITLGLARSFTSSPPWPPTTGCSAWTSSTSSWTAASPRHRAAVRSPDPVRSTVASRD